MQSRGAAANAKRECEREKKKNFFRNKGIVGFSTEAFLKQSLERVKTFFQWPVLSSSYRILRGNEETEKLVFVEAGGNKIKRREKKKIGRVYIIRYQDPLEEGKVFNTRDQWGPQKGWGKEMWEPCNRVEAS